MTMPDLWSLLSAPLVELLGWVLLHFVWQGALLAAVLAGALYVLRDHTPTVRYAVSCAALVGLLALPVGTGLFLSDSALVADSTPTTSVVVPDDATGAAVLSDFSAAEAAPSGTPSLRARVSAWLQPALPWIVMGWAVGVLLFSIRLAGGAWRVRRLRRKSTLAPDRWRDRLRSLADQMGLHRVPALRISDHVDGPMVAGWWRPVVLVPTGFLTGLPPDQVEALLLHELAHVRRHDVLVGRLQAVVETLLFFHPATWWISRQVRQTRETCCDDLAVQAGAERIVYARALLGLAKHTLTAPRTAGALSASGGSLLTRIRRLLDPSVTPSKNARRLSVAVALLLLVAVPLGVAACASQQTTTEAEATEAPPSEQAETPPSPPRAPEPEPASEDPTVVVVEDDSVRHEVSLRRDEAVEVDTLDEAYVFRYEGERDTIEVPRPEAPDEPEFFEGELRMALDADSLERVLRAQLNPDSLERVIMERVNPDSLERVLEARFDPDSFERVLRARIKPDSIERVFNKRFDPDSLERHVLRLRMRADSLSPPFDAPFFEEHFERRFGPHFPDSTFAFESEDFDFELDADSADVKVLLRRHGDVDVDSLFRWREHHADSLRRHLEHLREEAHRRMETLRERWTSEMPEQLRERARRLREQAEELEERAEELERRPAPPDSSG